MTAPQKDQFVFLPLGGAGEIGMNLNLYGLGPPGDETWVMVDLGVTFGDGAQPGVDVALCGSSGGAYQNGSAEILA